MNETELGIWKSPAHIYFRTDETDFYLIVLTGMCQGKTRKIGCMDNRYEREDLFL